MRVACVTFVLAKRRYGAASSPGGPKVGDIINRVAGFVASRVCSFHFGVMLISAAANR